MDIRRGIIRKFDSGTYLADVQIVGSMATMLTGVPVAKQIGADLLTSGTRCGVLFFDETNPADACVAFVYDGTPTVPCARVYNSVDQSIPNATGTVLAFDSERFDTDDIHDTTTHNSRLTCNTAGKYQITVQIRWGSSATGFRQVQIRLNAATNICTVRQGAHGADMQVFSTLYDLAVDDYLEVVVYQNSGAALNVGAYGNYSPEFMMVKVA